MNNTITLLSLALTPMTIIASAAVIYYFYQPFVESCTARDKTAVQWMILGVVTGFFGAILDNIWWGFAWSADFINPDSSFKQFFFDYGVYSNTIARQTLGVIAALCHIASAAMAQDKMVKRVTYWGALLGAFLVINLIYFKG